MLLIFTQERIGYMDRPFKIYKFKTLNGDAGKWGAFLRKTGLDELPQVINILKGDMALVGPRPLTPQDHRVYRGFVLPCKPGITGWWQIHDRVQKHIRSYDMEYLNLRKKLGFWFDLYIMWRTIPLVLFGRHG